MHACVCVCVCVNRQIKMHLGNRLYLDFCDDSDFDANVEKLIATMLGMLGEVSTVCACVCVCVRACVCVCVRAH